MTRPDPCFHEAGTTRPGVVCLPAIAGSTAQWRAGSRLTRVGLSALGRMGPTEPQAVDAEIEHFLRAAA